MSNRGGERKLGGKKEGVKRLPETFKSKGGVCGGGKQLWGGGGR